MTYVPSATLVPKKCEIVCERGALTSLKSGILPACSMLFSSIPLAITSLCISFSTGEISSQINGLPDSDGVQEILKENYFHSMDMVPLYICAFLDKTRRYTENGKLMK